MKEGKGVTAKKETTKEVSTVEKGRRRRRRKEEEVDATRPQVKPPSSS